jgi:hypothetical protein
MSNAREPFHFLIIALTGRLNRQQQVFVDYPVEEHRVLREKPGGQCLRFSDE